MREHLVSAELLALKCSADSQLDVGTEDAGIAIHQDDGVAVSHSIYFDPAGF